MGVGEGRSKKRVLVIKSNENDNVLYCGGYLSVNSGKCGVAGIVAEGKNIARTWLFMLCYVCYVFFI